MPTPENYRRLFCVYAKESGIDIKDCDRLTSLASKLSDEEKSEIEKKNIENVDSLFDYIIHKLREKEKNILGDSKSVFSDDTVEKLASLMMASLAPSCFIDQFNKSIDSFTDKISNDPHLIEDRDIQESIAQLIEKRQEADRGLIFVKAKKLDKLVDKMDGYIDTTLTKSGSSANTLSNISEEIKAITFDNIDKNTFDDFKSRIIDITSSIENEASELSNKLIQEQSEVSSLKKKIRSLEKNLKEAQKESSTDFLTGTLTRRGYDRKIKELNSFYENYGEDFIIIFIDIDHFKTVNDRYGHKAGDVVLSTFSKILLSKVRINDIVARYGGEKFVIILTDCVLGQAKELIGRIQDIVRTYNFIYEKERIKITFSAGITLRSEHESIEDTVKYSDELMYKAKKSGRDKIVQ